MWDVSHSRFRAEQQMCQVMTLTCTHITSRPAFFRETWFIGCTCMYVFCLPVFCVVFVRTTVTSFVSPPVEECLDCRGNFKFLQHLGKRITLVRFYLCVQVAYETILYFLQLFQCFHGPLRMTVQSILSTVPCSSMVQVSTGILIARSIPGL